MDGNDTTSDSDDTAPNSGDSTPDPDDPTTDAPDPTAIRSIAVSAEDVLDAFVYTRENPGTAVLRVTPPFHGRMRARLHVYHRDDAAVTGAIHLEPAALLAEEVVESYPDLEERLADASGETERIREAHAAAVERWRERARKALRDEVSLETSDGTHAIELKRLG